MSVAASSSVKCEVGVLTFCRVCRLVRVTARSSGCGIYRFLFTEEEASPSRQKWICPCSRGVSLHFDLRVTRALVTAQHVLKGQEEGPELSLDQNGWRKLSINRLGNQTEALLIFKDQLCPCTPFRLRGRGVLPRSMALKTVSKSCFLLLPSPPALVLPLSRGGLH